MTSPALRGVIPVIPMPFTEAGGIDETELAGLVRFLAELDVSAISFGFASEVALLTERERDLAVEVVADGVAGRKPVIGTVQAASTEALVERCRSTVSHGATALMVTPPSGGPYPPGELVSHFGRLSEELEVPIVIQDAPTESGVTLSINEIRALAERVEHIVAIKVEASPSAAKLGALSSFFGNRVGLLGGAGGVDFVNELNRGANGVMPGSAIPEVFSDVLRMHDRGDHAGARQLFNAVLPLLVVGGRGLETFCILQKMLLQRRGVLTLTGTRQPHSPEDRAALERELEACIDYALGTYPDLASILRP